MSDDAPIERSKYVRSFVHRCDDFVVEDDEGNEYHPHAGESVRFRAGMLWEMVKLSDPDEIIAMPGQEYARRIVRALAHQILWWDWTDDNGNRWPSPDDDPEGFADALWFISEDERQYLRLHCWDKSRLGEAQSSLSSTT